MAQGKTVVPNNNQSGEQEFLTPESVFPPALSPRYDDDEMDLADVLTELGGVDDAKINIYRTGGAKGVRGGEFVDSVHPSAFSLQWLRDTYGGGEYRIHIRGNGRLSANRLVKVADPIKKDVIPQQESNSNEIRQLTELMVTGFNKMSEVIASALQNRPQQIDPVTMQQTMLQNMLTMKQILGGNESQQQTNPMELFIKGVEFAKELKGDTSEREPGANDILLKALESFAPAIAGAAMAPRAPIQQQFGMTPSPAQIQHTSIAPVQHQGNNAMTQADNQLKQYAAMLVMIAKEDRDPFAYATMICDSAPHDQLKTLVSRPDLFEYLAALDPELAAPDIRPWLEEFVIEVKNIVGLTSENSGVTVPANTMSDNANAAFGNISTIELRNVGNAGSDSVG